MSEVRKGKPFAITNPTGISIGDKFHRLTLTSIRPYIFQCECGGEYKTTRPSMVIKGAVKSCGCLRRELAVEMVEARAEARRLQRNIRVGAKVGMLTIIGKAEARNNNACFEVRCDCGTVKIVEGRRINSTASCGCHRPVMCRLSLEKARQRQKEIAAVRNTSVWRGLFGTPHRVIRSLKRRGVRKVSLAGEDD